MKISRLSIKYILFGIVATASYLRAGTLIEDRKYQPVILVAGSQYVVNGSKISIFKNFIDVPVENLYLYRYHASDNSWTMMPFQIDERTYGPDPLNPDRSTWFYLIPPEWPNQQHDGKFSSLDELVFLIGDMGDQAPTNSWIDNAESRTHGRLELVVQDSLNPAKKAYAYLFQSSTITATVPMPYEFSYNSSTDQIDTKYYSVKHENHGVIENITIKEPGGNGKDIFDILKLRFAGVLDFAIPWDSAQLTETNFYLYPQSIFVTQHPVVRLIRRAKQTAKVFSYILDTNFWLKTHYFPYSGTIETGASIYKEDLEKQFPESEVNVILRYTRQSWDFNQNARGMKFYNPYNSGILVDGKSDNVNKTVDIPVNAWSLLTGDQGTIFTNIALTERNWNQVKLYYFDNQAGGQADSAQFDIYDTGDNESYGDNGIWLQNTGRDSITLDLDLSAYFIPEKNLNATGVQRIHDMASKPINVSSAAQTYGETGVLENHSLIHSFQLLQNYPNPFNGETEISFFLSRESEIQLTIVDACGRTVRTLVSGWSAAGDHRAVWNGRNEDGNPVASGIYLYRLKADNEIQTRKLILSQ
jgi:hypothetical protein